MWQCLAAHGFLCERGRSRTLNLQSRNLTLYPIELRVQYRFTVCKYTTFLFPLKHEAKFICFILLSSSHRL